MQRSRAEQQEEQQQSVTVWCCCFCLQATPQLGYIVIAKTETSSKQVRDIVEQTDQSIYCPTSCRPSCCAVCSGPSPFVYVCIVELIAWQHLSESRLVQFKQRQTLLREKEETLNGSNKLQRERNEGRRHARRRFKTEEFCARATHSSTAQVSLGVS